MRQSKTSGRNSRIWDMNGIEDKIIARLKTKSGQPVLTDPVGFANEVIDIVKTPRREATGLYFRFAWAAVLSSVIALIGIWWNSTSGRDDSDEDVNTFIEIKRTVSKQTISDISTTLNLVEQYKSLKK